MERDLARFPRDDGRFAGNTNPFSDRVHDCIPPGSNLTLRISVKQKPAGKPASTIFRKRLPYFWRTALSSTPAAVAGGTMRVVVFTDFGTAR
jgi:hypothetical protein